MTTRWSTSQGCTLQGQQHIPWTLGARPVASFMASDIMVSVWRAVTAHLTVRIRFNVLEFTCLLVSHTFHESIRHI